MAISRKLCEVVTNLDKLGCKIEDIETILKSKTNIYQYAYIIHDKDNKEDGSLKSPHIHIAIKFNNAQNFDYIAKWFGVQSSQVCTVKGAWKDVLLYLTHANALEKYQYPISDVVSNFDVQDSIKNGFFDIDYFIKEIELGNIRDYNLTDKVPITVYCKYKTVLNNAIEYYIRSVCNDMDRNINVVFMEGKSGSGKTTFAKKYCKDKNYSYVVSSSSNDVMQDYRGQDVLILDDLRDSDFTFSDLLKILDNHTKSSMKSRYSNKHFIGHTIIITSYKPLLTWYSSVSDDALVQLYRRISELYVFTMDSIECRIFDYITETWESLGFIRNPISYIIKTSKKRVPTMFDEDFSDLEPLNSQENFFE